MFIVIYRCRCKYVDCRYQLGTIIVGLAKSECWQPMGGVQILSEPGILKLVLESVSVFR